MGPTETDSAGAAPTCLADLDIDEHELREVVDAALARVTPAYAATGLASCSVEELSRPDGSRLTVLLLHLATLNLAAARGQYQPLTEAHDRGFVDEYLFGAIHGHWLAAHSRDLFHEVLFVLDVLPVDGDAVPLYRLVGVEEAQVQGLIPDASPLATTIRKYDLRRLLSVGGVVSGPSPGMAELVASETERLGRPLFLDLFAGACALARVALEHGARRAVCVDIALDQAAAAENLGCFAARAEFRRAELAVGLGNESYDMVAIDPFYDHTLIAIEECLPELEGRFHCMVVNLGLDLPTAWQARVSAALERHVGAMQVHSRHGERIAVCRPCT